MPGIRVLNDFFDHQAHAYKVEECALLIMDFCPPMAMERQEVRTSFFVGTFCFFFLLLDFYLLSNDGEVFSNILLDLACYILIISYERSRKPTLH